MLLIKHNNVGSWAYICSTSLLTAVASPFPIRNTTQQWTFDQARKPPIACVALLPHCKPLNRTPLLNFMSDSSFQASYLVLMPLNILLRNARGMKWFLSTASIP